MNKKILLTIMAIILPWAITAQTHSEFLSEIRESGYIHKPLKLHPENSVEAFGLTKKVLRSDILCDMESLDGWSHRGHGSIGLCDERAVSGSYSLRMSAPSMPTGSAPGIGRGSCFAEFDTGGQDWTAYNRIRLSVFPQCEGMRSIYLNLCFTNDGQVKVPDKYGREGQHEINLRNNEWNDCILEFPELPRDRITRISLVIEIFGRELTQGDSIIVDIDDIRLEKIEQPEVAKGWHPGKDRITVSGTGYTTGAQKTAVIGASRAGERFEIIDCAAGKPVFKGRTAGTTTVNGRFVSADFSALTTPGEYFLKLGKLKSSVFRIDDNVWEDSAWRMINFLFCERCGYPVPGKHGTCHSDIHIDYDGKIIPIHGGWHDAGDMAQQTLQTGEISYSLLQMAQTAQKKGNLELYNRLVEEAMWGMDFVLRSRLGDGVRMISWGTNLWTDGILGTWDDSGGRVCNVYNGAYENFVLSGIEAYAAMVLQDDPEMVVKLTDSAIQDFQWGLERYNEAGYSELQTAKKLHAKNTPESQYNASVSWAASMLYKLTASDFYAQQAVRFIELPLQCQRTEPVGQGLKGFFYGDSSRNSGVHYNHKSRDYAFMEALDALCETQGGHPDYGRWMNAIELYGGYLKDIMKYTAPYGMVPSGVYNINEVDYPELFYPWQLGAPRDSSAALEYYAQLSNGVKLDEEYYLRRFPVWYSFRGNTVVSLSTGKAAAICARVLGDRELRDIAEKQLSWVVGLNPFGQSLIYGEGAFWGQLYNALPGEMTGEIPVGIQALGNEDVPYWPQFNVATPKEVFGLTASRWLMLISEF